MIVLDASAAAELLLRTALGQRVEARLVRDDDEWHVPHLIDIEVLQVLRRLVRIGEIGIERALAAIEDLRDLGLVRHEHVDLLGPAFDLRDNLTAYDAIYVALAQALNAPLVTCDRAMGGAPDRGVDVELVR